MQSKFYSPGAQRAANVHRLFATIARRYDLLNDLMSAGRHRYWKRRLVAMAGQPRDVLDLCCGTGDLALLFRACVVGVDFTEEMLRVAQARSSAGLRRAEACPERFRGEASATQAGVPPVSGRPDATPRAGHPRYLAWVQADALRLPFPDDSFDVVTVGYGLRNLADIDTGLREILRVLRPGGKFLSLDFGKPEAPAWRALYFGYLRTVVPVLGRLFCGDPETHAYILASLTDYPAQRGICAQMAAVGFVACGFTEFLAGAMAINYGQKPVA